MRTTLFDAEEQAREDARAEIQQRQAESLRQTQRKRELDSEDAINRIIDEVHKHARKAVHFKDKAKDAVGRLKKMIFANPDLETGDPVKTAGRLAVVLFGWVGAYLFDYFLLGILSSYWLGMQAANHLVRTIAQFAIPAAFLALEIALATLLVNSFRKGRIIAQWAWAVFCSLVVIGVGWFTASMVLASEDVDSVWDLAGPEWGLLLFMVVISVMPHVILLFGGLLGFEGKAMIFVFAQRFSARRFDRKYQKAADNGLSKFRRFLRRSYEHERDFHGRRWNLSETFSAEAREIINERMGYEAIQAPDDFDPPDGPDAAAAGAAIVPPATPVNGVPAFARRS